MGPGTTQCGMNGLPVARARAQWVRCMPPAGHSPVRVAASAVSPGPGVR